mmetsp:Transcript_14854/g.45368  ORF Transcript_14854/g.45368 Transcript_14854/m.45368 type:complete len:288 (-) Transcript_14854:309-1172(-)
MASGKPYLSMPSPAKGVATAEMAKMAEYTRRASPESSPFSSSCVPMVPTVNCAGSMLMEKKQSMRRYSALRTWPTKERSRKGGNWDSAPSILPLLSSCPTAPARSAACVSSRSSSGKWPRFSVSTLGGTSTPSRSTRPLACASPCPTREKGMSGQMKSPATRTRMATPACARRSVLREAPRSRCTTSKRRYTSVPNWKAPLRHAMAMDRRCGKSEDVFWTASWTPAPPAPSRRNPATRPGSSDVRPNMMEPAAIASELAATVILGPQRSRKMPTGRRANWLLQLPMV